MFANGGGIYLKNSWSDVEFRNCLFAGNYSKSHGGGIYAIASDPVVSECTIVGNRADNWGGGIYCDDLADVSVFNSIVWGNSATNGGEQIAMSPVDHGDVRYKTITLAHCNVQGGREDILHPDGTGKVIWLDGNIDVDPLFADPGHWDDNGTPGDTSDDTWIDGDYHLKSYAGRWNPTEEEWANDEVHSPCIDAGNPGGDYSAEPLYNGHRINIGAYGGTEYASKTANCPHHPTGDLNKDCKVTFADLAMLAANWLDCNLEPAIACE
jgi:hypothetical protein